ncbi:hypothetical protein WDZ92_51380, partial [Nostoc sp. NIES-2111]
ASGLSVFFHGTPPPAGRKARDAARPLLPLLADYVDWMTASTALAANDYPTATEAAFRVLQAGPSALDARAVAIILQSARASNDYPKLQALLTKHARALSPAQRELFTALSYEWQGNNTAAYDKFLKLYLEYPRTAEAAEAASRIERSSVAPALLLERATRLLDSGDASTAKAEFTALLPRLAGQRADLAELAEVKLGVTDYRLRSASAAATFYLLPPAPPAAHDQR